MLIALMHAVGEHESFALLADILCKVDARVCACAVDRKLGVRLDESYLHTDNIDVSY